VKAFLNGRNHAGAEQFSSNHRSAAGEFRARVVWPILPCGREAGACNSPVSRRAQAASDQALTRHARREADYYALLNDDDDYLASELRRINWLQHSLKVRRLAARITNASILVALIVPTLIGRCQPLLVARFFSAHRLDIQSLRDQAS